MVALDEPADHRHLAKGVLQQQALLDPVDELLFENVGREEGFRVCNRIEAVAGEGVIVGDEAERFEPRMLHPARDQHAQRLMCVPALEAVGDHVVQFLMRERLDEQLLRLGDSRLAVLDFEPFADIVGEAMPVVAIREHVADAIGEVRRHRHALAAVGDDAAGFLRGMDDDVRILELLDLEAKAGEEEMIAGG